jgi:electron transport complex protein RnfG
MVVVLSVIAMVSAAVLAVVYGKTSVIIEENAARALESSVLEVLPGTATVNIIRREQNPLREEDPKEMREKEQKTTIIYQGVDAQGRIIGYAFVGEGNGYGGAIRVLVGVDESTDQVINLKILNHSETPGLGSRVEEEGFRNQFVGKTAQDPIAVNQDINAISGATISSRAVADAVRTALKDTVELYRGGE